MCIHKIYKGDACVLVVDRQLFHGIRKRNERRERSGPGVFQVSHQSAVWPGPSDVQLPRYLTLATMESNAARAVFFFFHDDERTPLIYTSLERLAFGSARLRVRDVCVYVLNSAFFFRHSSATFARAGVKRWPAFMAVRSLERRALGKMGATNNHAEPKDKSCPRERPPVG